MDRNPHARFSADPRIRVFDRIAWIYGLLFHVQRLVFRRGFRALRHRLALPGRARILDIGCGTGAYISVLAEMGHEVRAVDASPRMIAAARRLLRQAGRDADAVDLSVGDPLEGLDFPDQHFDLVLAAHVLHGMLPAQRRRFYREARRVSRGSVLFHDYSPRGSEGPRDTHGSRGPRDSQGPRDPRGPRDSRGPRFFTRVLEALERSDYRRFRRSGTRELRDFFAEVEVIAAAPGSAWYLCRSRS